ncbi:hypothetical protein HGM15179_012850 [Zosterops borbonicus]|uniref:Reverse transcriptase RNase H-like domain-containing protein n=1 Tax=Zosterops borbonicus TaxID=364589 RepID=A0A8K1LHX2_9PASS|nr:hypothetical protein HGM15179_012850 [Zosterops borbonicus]
MSVSKLHKEWVGKRKPIGFLSKILDPVSWGWPTCLQAIVAVALLVEEARKITFGASLIVYTPHDVRNILQQKAEKWLTDSRLLKYEAILISSLGLELKTTSARNPAQFTFGDPSEELLHDCAEIVELQTKVDSAASSGRGGFKPHLRCLGTPGKTAFADEGFCVQNQLTLDYLLAEEGGVCGRFNESECCIEIDDYGEMIKGLAQEIKKEELVGTKDVMINYYPKLIEDKITYMSPKRVGSDNEAVD